jgi:hypothetical protein
MKVFLRHFNHKYISNNQITYFISLKSMKTTTRTQSQTPQGYAKSIVLLHLFIFERRVN